jgi:ADP-heptose:LPS heptosyltransferase
MNTGKQIFLDKFIAKPTAFLLNFFVRFLGKVLSINHNLDLDFKRIAVCKFKGMGSILQSTPMVSALRKKFPNAEIIYVSVSGNRGVISKIKEVDTIITVDDSGLWKFAISNITALYKLMKLRPDVYFDLEIYSDYSTIFTTLTLSKNRIGYYLRSSSFRMGIYTHMMFYNPRVPIAAAYQQLALLLGCEPEGNELIDLTHYRKESIEYYFVVNVNASDLRLERRWAMQSYVDLIKKIRLAFPETKIMLIGSKGERAYTSSITDEINDPMVICKAGETSLDGLFELIANAQAMITNDTGPMHIAFCAKIPVLCLFGPCSPDQYGSNPMARIIYKPVYCSPCVHDFEIPPCKGDNQCMKLIEVEEVYKEFVDMLNNPTKNMDRAEIIYAANKKALGTVLR